MSASQSLPFVEAEKAIRRLLLGLFGSGANVATIEPYAYETSFPLYRAVLETGGKRFRLIVKDSGQSGAGAAMGGKPSFLYHPLREVFVYREVLSELSLGTPRFYGSAHDEQLKHIYAVLEHVDGRELWQVGEFSLWLQVAAQLARQHEILERYLSRRPRGDLPLIEYSQRLANTFLERAHSFTSNLPRITKLLSKASQYLAEQGEEFYSQPPTIVHGDFYPANILLQDESEGATRICVLDWELAGRGPGLLDLGSLVAGKWTPQARRELATSYYEAMSETGQNQNSRRRFDRQLAFARMQTAMRWLGWSETWHPPAQQQNDWIAELEGSLEELASTAEGT